MSGELNVGTFIGRDFLVRLLDSGDPKETFQLDISLSAPVSSASEDPAFLLFFLLFFFFFSSSFFCDSICVASAKAMSASNPSDTSSFSSTSLNSCLFLLALESGRVDDGVARAFPELTCAPVDPFAFSGCDLDALAAALPSAAREAASDGLLGVRFPLVKLVCPGRKSGVLVLSSVGRLLSLCAFSSMSSYLSCIKAVSPKADMAPFGRDRYALLHRYNASHIPSDLPGTFSATFFQSFPWTTNASKNAFTSLSLHLGPNRAPFPSPFWIVPAPPPAPSLGEKRFGGADARGARVDVDMAILCTVQQLV
mmetsp:Transcript_1394/g.8598  ORF Transcript_1394/g.8598 Transcript_1394/m.8598 type:complete len:310 (-) Transcript_1394:27-956(-)